MAESDFPADLRDAQTRLHRTRAEYEELCRELPWSVEPMPGWEGDKQLHSDRIGAMPDSPGYTGQQKTEVARLRGLLLELTEQVTVHPFWQELRGPDLVEARMALKRTTTTERAAPAG
ncbi:hypothetical protein [Streptomyces jumonjinensis]|uniref:Uncharacterized protein n=1 Tax=Streptomyces jumonjinensis TaxID=1945 RepID=A0A646KL23_STRJU|nr:hypothetical protein [Streptomyces jumonjinensis]MQT02748.1 hypothetical protein [Streptomyces jumonjinensis]